MGLGIKTFVRQKLGLGNGFEAHYDLWRSRRLSAIVTHYGPNFFERKRVLELGAGYGHIGAFFALLGADVTCIEGRATNIPTMRKRFPFLKTQHADLNNYRIGEDYDVIIHMGLLYHLREFQKSLEDACKRCDHLILESEVSDSINPDYSICVEEKHQCYDQALDGVGSRPSPAHLEKLLTENRMKFDRITDNRCDSGMHTYTWIETNSGKWDHGQRAFWFCKKIN